MDIVRRNCYIVNEFLSGKTGEEDGVNRRERMTGVSWKFEEEKRGIGTGGRISKGP